MLGTENAHICSGTCPLDGKAPRPRGQYARRKQIFDNYYREDRRVEFGIEKKSDHHRNVRPSVSETVIYARCLFLSLFPLLSFLSPPGKSSPCLCFTAALLTHQSRSFWACQVAPTFTSLLDFHSLSPSRFQAGFFHSFPSFKAEL